MTIPIDDLKVNFEIVKGVPLREALNRPIRASSRQKRAASLLSGETKTITAITFGDLIYDVVRIDPTVVEAADFARAADLSDIPSFVTFADSLSNRPSLSLSGDISQIQGYVAEQLVAYSLRSQGAEVELPSTSNQAGYDLIVNGTQFQVKCLASPSGVTEHLEKNPHIPVFVNEELASKFEGDPRVIPVEGIRHDEIRRMTEESIEAGVDVLDFSVPLITAAIMAGKNGLALLKKTTTPRSAAENFSLDVSSRSAGSAAGGALTGAALWGIGITAGWPTLIIPIVGAAAGYEVGKGTADWIKAEIFCREEKNSLQQALITYLDAVILVLDTMIAKTVSQRNFLKEKLENGSIFERSLWENWQDRINDEIEYRKLQRSKLSYAAQESGMMEDTKNLDEATIAALVTSRMAGVLPVNAASEHRVLLTAYGNYRNAMMKRLL
jgi:hypothetical protein